ncbi:MAG: hypothetical protein IJ447_03010 [Clostridia bacterium]|nr:hypothetical protein [Clostridia bacterium]
MDKVFEKFLQFRAVADEPTYDCRENCYMRLYRGVTETEYSEWISVLEKSGFEVLQKTENNGNLYTCLKGEVLVNAFFSPCDGILRVAASENVTTPCFEPTYCEGDGETAFYGFESDQALIDCGMCLLIECPDHSFFVVDSGHYMQFNDNDRIYNFMRERTPEGQKVVVNGWLLSHAHSDHISKFMDFLRYNCHDCIIEGIYSNLIPDDYHGYKNWTREEVLLSKKLFKMLEETKIPTYKIHTGQRFYIRNLMFDVLGTHEDIYPNLITDYNDSSCMVMLTAENSRIFIPGDASALSSIELEKRYGEALKCDVVQVSHHGHNGLSKTAYEYLNAEVAVFPITRIKFDEEYPRIEANRRLIELAKAHYITSDGTVKIPLPYSLDKIEVLPDETFEDFGKINRLWGYSYTDERKKELYDMFVARGGDLNKTNLPAEPDSKFEM